MAGEKTVPENSEWDWKVFPETDHFLGEQVAGFLAHHSSAREFANRIEHETSSSLTDWIDHLVIPAGDLDEGVLENLGYCRDPRTSTDQTSAYRHTGSIMFPVLLTDEKEYTLALRVENLDEFRHIHARQKEIDGAPGSPYRHLEYAKEGLFHLIAVERRGYHGFSPPFSGDNERYLETASILSGRKRNGITTGEGFRDLEHLVATLLDHLDASRVADAFFRAERTCWAERNAAARIIKERQDRLGLGFGNHDHHAFRSSRNNFSRLLALFRLLGMEFRECFYAGHQAGWGAQILEHPDCGTVIFADVDLSPEEREMDFSRHELPERTTYGTIGLWVGLHGESILSAGLHHLALRFSFDKVAGDLRERGIRMMEPFSDYYFLRQAFTEGEQWMVPPASLKALEQGGVLTQRQSSAFRRNGAIGSHVENIQRRQGFKGFNQDSVSIIISETDPRRPEGSAA